MQGKVLVSVGSPSGHLWRFGKQRAVMPVANNVRSVSSRTSEFGRFLTRFSCGTRYAESQTELWKVAIGSEVSNFSPAKKFRVAFSTHRADSALPRSLNAPINLHM